MKTTWPKLTYPVRPVMKFIEYASAEKTRRPMRIVKGKIGIQGAATATTTRKTAIPQAVGPSLGIAGSFIGGCPRAGTAGRGSASGRRPHTRLKAPGKLGRRR